MRLMRLVCISLLCCNLSAATYQGITGNKDISLTVKSIPYGEFADMLKDLGKAGTLPIDTPIQMTSIKQALKQYLAFLVTIQNNSTKTICVDEKLIADIGNCYTTIDELLEIYKPHIESCNRHISHFPTKMFGGSLLILFLSALCTVSFIRKKAFHMLVFGIVIALVGIIMVFEIIERRDTKKRLTAIHEKKEWFKRFNHLITQHKKITLATQDTYEINPKETLIALLLIDTHQGSKNIFKRKKPALLYQYKEAL